MSVKVFQAAFQRKGVPRAQAAELASTVFETIEYELANHGSFLLRGIGRLEVVSNRLGNHRTPIGGHQAEATPVRIRLKVSKVIKEKISDSYRPSE